MPAKALLYNVLAGIKIYNFHTSKKLKPCFMVCISVTPWFQMPFQNTALRLAPLQLTTYIPAGSSTVVALPL